MLPVFPITVIGGAIKEFIICGSDLTKDKSFNTFWKLNREPFMLETSVPGIFASEPERALRNG